MPWQEIEASLAHQFARQVKAGKQIEGIGLFGSEVKVVGGGKSNAGRPRLPIRLMVSLLYLKHAFNESDEGLVERWAETPTWQYFSGMDYFEHRLPCDATLIGKFRKLIGEQGVEEMLSQTIAVALNLKVISKKSLETVVVDSTVQPKAIAHPTDSRLLEVARQKLVEVAKDAGISLKQTFAKEGRQIERQMAALAEDMKQTINEALHKAQRLVTQTKHRKTKGIPKLYSWHAPEVEVIAKGKARNPYEFGIKVGITSTLKGNLILGARSFPNNPYDVYGRSLFAKRFFTVLTLQTRLRLQSYIRALSRPSYPLPMMDSADKHLNRPHALIGAPSYSGFVCHGLTCLAITV
jgi:IS5 family transposase